MARTNRDATHLRKLRDLHARIGCIPSYSKLAAHLGFKAKNAAFKLVDRLVASGYLLKGPGGRLIPDVAFFALELSDDVVRAGFGAEGSATDLLQPQAIDQLLISKPSKTFLVSVRGDSMMDAGILSGDIAVVETDLQSASGDIVVAEIDGSITVKELQIKKGRPWLVPHNSSIEAQTPRESLRVVGVVRGIVRRYKPLPTGRGTLTRWGVTS